MPREHGGWSTTLRLAIHKVEPTHEIKDKPVMQWAKSWWDDAAPREILEAAWRRQMPRICLAEGVAEVLGPAAAVAEAL